MDSKEALEFINRLFWENEKPILNELEESIFLGIGKGDSYADITAKTITANTPYSEPHVRDTGAKLCKRIKEDLGIKKKNRVSFVDGMETVFSQVPDIRIERSKLHLLDEILMLSLCAVLCGAEDFEDIENYGKEKEAFLRTFLSYPSGKVAGYISGTGDTSVFFQ